MSPLVVTLIPRVASECVEVFLPTDLSMVSIHRIEELSDASLLFKKHRYAEMSKGESKYMYTTENNISGPNRPFVLRLGIRLFGEPEDLQIVLIDNMARDRSRGSRNPGTDGSLGVSVPFLISNIIFR
jgi:hypothetical protein